MLAVPANAISRNSVSDYGVVHFKMNRPGFEVDVTGHTNVQARCQSRLEGVAMSEMKGGFRSGKNQYQVLLSLSYNLSSTPYTYRKVPRFPQASAQYNPPASPASLL